MGNVDQTNPSVTKLAHHIEQSIHLSLGKRRGRFVHDHQLHVQGACLRNLNHLLTADAQLIDRGCRVDIQADHLQPLLCFLAHLPLINEFSRRTLSSEEDILRHGKEGNQRNLLVDKRDAQLLCLVNAVDFDLLAVNLDRSFILFIDTAKTVHQS